MQINLKRYILLSLFVLTLISCAGESTNNHNSSNNSCDETRAALDIGSGTTKLIVAQVDTCTNQLHNIIFEAQRPVALKDNLQKSKKNKFSKEIVRQLIITLNELSYLAQTQGATKIKAVATSAFRTADNALEVKKEIEENVNFQIKVISQKEEALFAYYAARNYINNESSFANFKDRPIVVWDIGGGSMQIVKEDESRTIKSENIYFGHTASVSFKNSYLNELKTKNKSPNPLLKEGAINAMNLSRKIANKEAKPILGDLSNYPIFGVGGVHFFSVKNQVAKNQKEANITQESILNTLLARAKLSDKEIGGEYAQTDVTNLALVLGFMQSLKIEKIEPLKINMANGILLFKEIWNN